MVLATTADLREVLVCRGHAHHHAARLEELRSLATGSAGLQKDVTAIVAAQRWLLSQLRQLDGEVVSVEEAIAGALTSWPTQELEILSSLPGMTTLRAATLVSVMGDPTSFRNDRQLRKLLGWYPEAKESATSVSKHQLGQSGSRMARRELWLWVMQLLSPKTPPTPFRAYYSRLRQRGVPGRTAIGHVAGKLISILFPLPPQWKPL